MRMESPSISDGIPAGERDRVIASVRTSVMSRSLNWACCWARLYTESGRDRAIFTVMVFFGNGELGMGNWDWSPSTLFFLR